MNVDMVNVHYSLLPFNDIRLKLNSRCNWDCKFCHREGSQFAGDLAWTSDLAEFLHFMQKEMNIRVVHLTGGEPTLHKDILLFITRLHEQGFEVRLTSNGTFSAELLYGFFKSGLSSINISLPALAPLDLLATQDYAKNESWAAKQINTATSNLFLARELGIKAKINCTVSGYANPWRQLLDYGEQHDFAVRFQNDLNSDCSIAALRHIVLTTNSVLTAIRRKYLTSRISYEFQMPSGYRYEVKLILPTELSSMCEACSTRSQCREWFYTIRVEQGASINVRLCLHRDDHATVMTSQNFLSSPHLQQFRAGIAAFRVLPILTAADEFALVTKWLYEKHDIPQKNIAS